MVLQNGISVTATDNTATFTKIVGGKILSLTKECKTVEKCLFWSKMYGTMSDIEWQALITD